MLFYPKSKKDKSMYFWKDNCLILEYINRGISVTITNTIFYYKRLCSRLGKKKLFSILDLEDGFHYIKLHLDY